jgi:Rps23 Pro-64 3,4-dihydroxylase Tpa1-like proline 4-hydroxylase
LEALARGGTMAYLFFVKNLAKVDPTLGTWFSDAMIAKSNEVYNQENNYFEEPQVTMYSSGCFLGQHTDGVGNRQVACIANFTRDWQPDFGGCITLLSKGKWQVIPPLFNSLLLLNVRAANCHYVSQVASWVLHKRTAITGWAGRR